MSEGTVSSPYRWDFRFGSSRRAARRVAEALEPLASKGYVVVHGLKSEKGRVDHVVVGPTGAYAIAVGCWRGRARIHGDGTLFVGRRNRDEVVSRARSAVVDVKRRWPAIERHPVVEPVVVLPRARVGDRVARARRVAVVGLSELVPYLESGEEMLRAEEVRVLVAPLLHPAASAGALVPDRHVAARS